MSNTNNSKAAKNRVFSCTDCGVLNCHKRTSQYPDFCLTTNASEETLEEVAHLYEDDFNRKVSSISAEIENDFYGRFTRVEEIVEFAKQMGFHKIGIATCVGLIEESRIFSQILRKHGFEVYGVLCKAGACNKTDLGVPEEKTKITGNAMCNPILQAKLLNQQEVDLNVVVGLCVGHDSLFYKYANAISTTLITKDRVLAHNPAAALYASKFYYKRLLADPVEE